MDAGPPALRVWCRLKSTIWRTEPHQKIFAVPLKNTEMLVTSTSRVIASVEKAAGLPLFDFSTDGMPKMQWTLWMEQFLTAGKWDVRWLGMEDQQNLTDEDHLLDVVAGTGQNTLFKMAGFFWARLVFFAFLVTCVTERFDVTFLVPPTPTTPSFLVHKSGSDVKKPTKHLFVTLCFY